ncbi:MAG: UDP-2,3-diacylglucosamine diphosphatase [Tannerellaceae bacterium]|jgi:UDP-2,3-diacylglucosamine hydrolase|nr:UDP-2,3-diacylglucosamine diphosphatase [Tannerellaceae bacterium]
MTNQRKIYFAADAHLGARYHQDPAKVEKLLAGWMGEIRESAAAVYFLGDMFDYWFEYKYVVPKGYIRFLGKLAELADAGIEIHLLIGNHDIWMFDYLPKEINAVIHRDMITVDLLGKRFLLGHGDEPDYRSRMFRFLRAFFRNPICQRLYASVHPRWTSGLALGWSHGSRKGGLKPKDEAADMQLAVEYLTDFAETYLQTHPDIDFFIFGHLHLLLDHRLSQGSRLLIAGDWMRLFSWIEWDGQSLEIKRLLPG